MSITNTKNDIVEKKLLVAMGEGGKGIEAQEAQGQRELVKSSQLPAGLSGYRSGPGAKEIYEKLGIKVIGPSKGDELFLDVELPSGWSKKATDHDMWSDLLDDKGRKRAGIFYKAAFYDRKADISFEKKIHYRVDRLGFLQGDYSQVNGVYNAKNTPFCGHVTDFDGTILFKTHEIDIVEQFKEPNGRGGYTDRYRTKLTITENELRDKCLEFLKENYPDYENVLAYW
ncbi:MAG: hypothetical protein AABY15_00410 [Nanoarchaeota archaeon]